MSTEKDSRTAVDKAMSLLLAFGSEAHVGLGVSELARRADMSKSTAFRVLGMLERNRAVERAGTIYRLGPLLHDLGKQVYSPAHDAIRDLLTPYLAELYEATHQTVHLAVLHGTDIVYLNKLHGHRRVRTPSRIGGRVPAYCTGVGKVLLAYDQGAAVETMRGKMVAWTPNTITSSVQLEQELFEIRRAGVGFDRGESMPELTCIAAPIFGPHGRPIAALSISGQLGHFDPAAQAHTLRQLTFAASRAFNARGGSMVGKAPSRASA